VRGQALLRVRLKRVDDAFDGLVMGVFFLHGGLLDGFSRGLWSEAAGNEN
jgi:hypothetical protein